MKILVLTFLSFILLYANDIQRVDSMIKDIHALKMQNNDLQTQLIILKDKVFIQASALQTKPKVITRTIIKRVPTVVKATKKEEENPLPKLQYKPQYFKAGTFRFSHDADIYDASENGKVIARWEEQTSFTSSKRTDDMIKITGYFVDKIWRHAQKPMWVKSEDTFER